MKQVIHKHKTQHRWSLFASDARRRNAGDFVAVATTSISPSRDVAVTGHKIFNRVAAASAVALVALTGVATLGVNVRKQASALEGDGSESLTVGDGKIAKLSTTVLPNMTLSLAQDVNLQVKPSAEGQFGRKDLAVNVGTNNTAGYTLTMWANSAKLTRRENRENESYAIDSLTGSVTCTDETLTTCDNFPVNKWGYRINGVDSRFQEVAYSSVANATESQPRLIGETDESADNSITTVHFGTKLDNRIPTGEYSGVDLTFTATTKIVSYSIDYRKGNSEVSDGDVSNLPDQQTGRLETQADTEVTLRTGTPTRTNYDFKGWCTVEPTTDPQSMTDSCTGSDSWGTPAQVLQAGAPFTITPTMAANVILYAMWNIRTPAVTFTLNTGVSSVKVVGKFADGAADKTVTASSNNPIGLMAGQRYTFEPGYVNGYEQADSNYIQQIVGTGTLDGLAFTPDENVSTIALTAQPRKYDVTIKTTDHVTQVSLNGTTCSSTSGCKVTGLTFGQNYTLAATVDVVGGYQVSSWTVDGVGSVDGSQFTVGAGTATITPVVEAVKYTCTKQYRLENADGNWGSYTTDTTEQVAYGGTCSYSKTVTDYKGSASGNNNTAATNSVTMGAGNATVQVSLYRNTFTLTMAKDDKISSTTPAAGTSTRRWGEVISISATASGNNKFKNWTQTSGTTSSFGSATTASTTFTMPKSDATIQANGEANGLNGMTSCDLAQGATTTLTDTRDGQSYKIGKLADGKCWMLENLRLGAVDLQVTQLDDTNTHITNGSTIAAATFNSTWQKTSGSATYTSPEYINQSGSDTYGSYGTLYNYCAASAGTYCANGGSGSGNASSDLCPKGWRLPTGNTNGEFQALYNAEGSFANFRSHFQLPLSGYFNSSTPYSQGSNGYWWSSTRNDGNSMYTLYIGSSSANPANNDYRYNGFSIRCVFGS